MDFKEFRELFNTVKQLRHPQHGCPWDLKQNHQTLLPYLIEESYEFIEAVEKQNPKMMKEELGDVLFQVVLHSTLSEESKTFTFNDVCKNINEKLIHRHPHVFEKSNPNLTSEEVKKNWEKLKRDERLTKGEIQFISPSILNAPALKSAEKIGNKTKEVGFDWTEVNQVIYKVEEEWQELKEELPVSGQSYNKERVEEELGDLLFSIAQLSRHLQIDPEECLRKANKKFLNRFHHMEVLINNDNKNILELNADELESYWNNVKRSL